MRPVRVFPGGMNGDDGVSLPPHRRGGFSSQLSEPSPDRVPYGAFLRDPHTGLVLEDLAHEVPARPEHLAERLHVPAHNRLVEPLAVDLSKTAPVKAQFFGYNP